MADFIEVFNYDVFPYAYHCDGNESSLFECNYTEGSMLLLEGYCEFVAYAVVTCQCKLYIPQGYKFLCVLNLANLASNPLNANFLPHKYLPHMWMHSRGRVFGLSVSLFVSLSTTFPPVCEFRALSRAQYTLNR